MRACSPAPTLRACRLASTSASLLDRVSFSARAAAPRPTARWRARGTVVLSGSSSSSSSSSSLAKSSSVARENSSPVTSCPRRRSRRQSWDGGGGGAAHARQRGLGGPEASAARGLVVVDVGRGTAAPAVPFVAVASLSSTLAASATVVVGRWCPLLATSSLSTPAASVTVVGQRRPPFLASSSPTLAASATVVAVVGRRRPPLATSSSSTPASSASSSRVSASRPPLMAATAFVRSTAASPLLAFLRGVPSAGSSLGVLPAISGSLTPSIQAARGGVATR